MKKIISLSVLAVAIVAAAGAQTPAKKAPAKATAMVCAVMPANKIDIASATKKGMFADYKGNRYFFCCAGCPEAFKKDPAKFAKAPHIATPKAPKSTKTSR